MNLQAIGAIRDATLESVMRLIDLDQYHSADNDDGYHANGSAHHPRGAPAPRWGTEPWVDVECRRTGGDGQPLVK